MVGLGGSGTTRLMLGLLQALVGLSGGAGGLALAAEPSGALLGLSAATLEGSPFPDYLVPGLALAALGLAHLAGAFVTFSRRPRAGGLAVVLGLGLMIWIVAQVAFLGRSSSTLQFSFFALGLIEVLQGIILARSAPSSRA